VNAHVLDGRYALVELIATGGMGEVWRGIDQILGRPVAIKMLAAMHADDEQFRARFRAEARYASSLSHPGITRVFDYGERSPLGGPYLVMELVDGQPLSEILERHGRLDPYVVLDIVAQSARALDIAHQSDIVHRDIKPGNLLIMADGTTKITDFGIAKANSLQAMQLTATGIVMGTALYVSPEQATGSPLTGSSDIYSLGVVAYECLSGEPPFMADQPLAIAIMHKHEPVPPLPPDVPRPVADLVYTMLAKAPGGRPETAQHVADRADVIREARSRSGHNTGPITANLPVVPNFPPPDGNDFYNNGNDFYNGEPAWSPDPRPRRRALVFAGAGLAACGIIALIVLLLTSSTTPAATMTGKDGHNKSPGQSASEAATPTTASVPASSAGGSTTGTNLETETKAPHASSSASPTTSARKSSTPTQSAPSTSTSSSASATTSSGAPTGTATSTGSAPPSSPPPTSPTTPAAVAAATPVVGIGG